MSDTGATPGNIGVPCDIRTDIAHPARVYDYWLGGKDNFAADREHGERQLGVVPHMRNYARGNRQFMVRAVRFLCDAGVRQFLDIGAGLPTSPNVHEIAQQADPGSRVVYVDNHPCKLGCVQARWPVGLTKANTRGFLASLDASGPLANYQRPQYIY